MEFLAENLASHEPTGTMRKTSIESIVRPREIHVREYVVDVSAARSWSEFISAFNEGFVRQFGGDWNGNLDAFNDQDRLP